MNYLVDLYHRAMNNQKLTTHERAILKAIQGAVIGFFVAVIPQLFFILAAGGSLNLTRAAINTLLTALALAILKLWAAQGDAHLGDVIDAYSKTLSAQAITEMTQPSDGSVSTINIAIPLAKAIASMGTMATETVLAKGITPSVQTQPPVSPVPTSPQFVPAPTPISKQNTAPLPAQPIQTVPAVTPPEQPGVLSKPTENFDHSGNTAPDLPIAPPPGQ